MGEGTEVVQLVHLGDKSGPDCHTNLVGSGQVGSGGVRFRRGQSDARQGAGKFKSGQFELSHDRSRNSRYELCVLESGQYSWVRLGQTKMKHSWVSQAGQVS